MEAEANAEDIGVFLALTYLTLLRLNSTNLTIFRPRSDPEVINFRTSLGADSPQSVLLFRWHPAYSWLEERQEGREERPELPREEHSDAVAEISTFIAWFRGGLGIHACQEYPSGGHGCPAIGP